MYLVYLDESGNSGTNLNDQQQPIFVLGALIVEETKWRDVEEGLESIVEAHFPSPRPPHFEMHGTELRNGKGYFRGFPVTERLDAWHECMQFAEEQGLNFVYRAIDKKRYLGWLVDTFGEGVLINPHVVAFPLIAQVTNAFLAGEPGSALGIFISDENTEIAPDVEKSIRLLRGADTHLKLDHIIEKGFFIDSKKSLVLQLCDLCAFAARKKEEQKAGIEIRSTDHEAIRLLDPLIHVGKEGLQDVLAWIAAQEKEKAARD
jgi:hypothetical protein